MRNDAPDDPEEPETAARAEIFLGDIAGQKPQSPRPDADIGEIGGNDYGDEGGGPSPIAEV